ncbi:hypothetical protein [Achromobacter pestifer]|uniref:SMI1/KNR4 family protein n=1 Tax=Achromobacter pestifer TaxID=1353889 RepID=A0A6S6ZHU2_9BURK|nr:hypothetical protein [Achromobacter pestifer]CAB3649128.1 hypothetical protein LMG3431_02717 [Achromobacter pestifer]
MILKTVGDVSRYTIKLSYSFPSILAEMAVVPDVGGISDDVISILDLPPKYVSIAREFRLAGVSIGFFSLWPSAINEPLGQSMMKENSGESLIKKLKGTHLVAVGRYEANLICVAPSGSSNSDHVYHLNTMASSNWELTSIAKDFEIFLALAANVRQASDDVDRGIKGGLEAAERFCQFLGCTAEQTKFWKERTIEMM